MGNAINRNVQATNSKKSDTSRAGREPQLQELKSSAWSLGSLTDRLNWSFTSSPRTFYSFSKSTNKNQRNRSKSSRQYSKTAWPVPFTESIFLPHFKRSNNNNCYDIVDVISHGAFGIVFKVVRNDNRNLSYALKVLKKSNIIRENCVQQLKDEINIQKVCGHHPFIVKQIDCWQNKSNLHILLEYIPGGELFTKICKFPYELVRLYVAEIALAIDFLHNAGIIFRDVKPENILLSSDYHIKLTDFGLSKWLKFGERTKTMCGTLQYMAPEILKGEEYGHAVDWWSLGVVACRMLTEKYPNTRWLIKEKLNQQESSEDDAISTNLPDFCPMEEKQFFPKEVEKLPNDMKDLLNRLLDYDCKVRLRSVMSLQRIALYRTIPINANFLKEISPLEILRKENISLTIENNEHFQNF